MMEPILIVPTVSEQLLVVLFYFDGCRNEYVVVPRACSMILFYFCLYKWSRR